MTYKMDEAEVRDRLERIGLYNTYHLRAGQPLHCMTETGLARLLAEWGFDPGRAKGIGYNPPQSSFFQKIRAAAGSGYPAPEEGW
jgi:hypothetical protein